MQRTDNDYILSIDGLRAVAVLCVLLFHLDISEVAGGYIGVDVFFVISGFVITRKLLAEIERGEFSFGRFYLWRIARLFPALFVTILLTLAAAYFVLGPEELANLGHVAILTVVSGSNIFFWLESGYFDAAAEYKPLLHTWSLAVEEQFYLVWPLLIWAAITRSGRRIGLVLLGVLGIISLAAALYFVTPNPNAVFFLTPFRVYQFAIGGSLAFVGLPRDSRYLSGIAAFSLVAILAVANTAIAGEKGYLLTAVAPAVAAGLAIWSAKSAFSNYVLASWPAVWIGQRSYAIYLAHWPIIVLWKMATDYALSTPDVVAGFVISIVAGAALHSLVERPFRFRKGQHAALHTRTLVFVSTVCVAIFLAASHFWGLRGFPERVPEELRAMTETIRDEWRSRARAIRTGVCSFQAGTFEAKQYDRAKCSNPPSNGKSYLIIGDSIASDMYLVFSKAFPDVYFGQVTVPGCPLRMPARFEQNNSCRDLYRLGFEELALGQDYDGIILASDWPRSQYDRIDDILKHFEGTGLEVILIGEHIRFAHHLPAIVSSSISVGAAIKKARHLILNHQIAFNKVLRKRFADRSTFIDFIDLQCEPECAIFDDEGRLAYLDHLHISVAGADLLADRLRSRHPDLFDSSNLAAVK